MAYRDVVLADSPVDFYEMETGTGTDSGSGAKTLTLSNITTGVAGIVGNAWSFNGTNSSATNAAFPGGTAIGNITLEAWVKAPSNGGWSNDYQTFIRRDGTDIILLRGRGSNITGGVQPGKAEVYLAGSTIYSTTRVDDGNWHHVVLRVAGTSAKLYVDGVEEGSASTAKATYNFGTGAFYVGSAAGTGEFYKGSLDNVAVYSSALSATRITAHYDAGKIVNITTDLSTVTVSTQAQDPDVTASVTATVNAATVTASAQAYDPTVETKFIHLVYPSRDQTFTPTSYMLSGNNTLSVQSGGYIAKIDFELPADLHNGGLDSATLRLTTTATSAGNVRIRKLTSEWSTDDVNGYSNFTASTDSVIAALPASGAVAIDVTTLVADPSNFYGFVIDGQGADASIYSMDSATNKPRLDLDYHDVASVGTTFDADTPNLTTLANDSEFSGGMSIVMPTATSTIGAVEAIVSTPFSTSIDLDTPTVSTQGHEASFEELRTLVIYPYSDVHRAQGSDTWVNNTNYLEINGTSSATASSLFALEGTSNQQSLVNRALARFDFPLELIRSGLLAKTGKNTITVRWQELDPGESLGTTNGEFFGNTGLILLDLGLESDPDKCAEVLIHEIAHAVDEYYLTEGMRVNIWNAMHPGTAGDIPDGTPVDTNNVVANGEYWLGGGDYFTQRVGEAWADAFVKSYSNVVLQNENHYNLAATDDAADQIRHIVTPSMPLQRGPFPVRTPAARLYFDALPGALVTGVVKSATLRLNVLLNSYGGNFGIKTLDPQGRQSVDSPVTTTTLPTGINNIDIASVFNPKNFSIIHVEGASIGTTQLVRISSVDNGVTTTEPRLTVVYGVPRGAVVFDADTPSTSATSYDVTVEATTSPNVEQYVPTVSVTAKALEPTVSAPVEINLSDTDTVMLGGYDPDVSAGTNVAFEVDSPIITAHTKNPREVNGEPIVNAEKDDDYFNSTWSTLRGYTKGYSGGMQGTASALSEGISYWFRFNEQSGDVAYDRAYDLRDDKVTKDAQALLNINQVKIGNFDGPEGRHSFYFNGQAFTSQIEPYMKDEVFYFPSSLEFTFRTTKSTQFIMGGSDQIYSQNSVQLPPWELWMVDGRLELRQYKWDLTLDKTTVRGFKQLNDGKWHHVVFQNSNEGTQDPALSSRYFGMEMWIDGTLDIRRRVGVGPQGFPDRIGGRESNYYGYGLQTTQLAATQWFVGDMTEVVFRNGRTLGEDEIHLQYDNMFGHKPVYAEPARINLKSDDVTVKGNKPRLLILNFGPLTQWRYTDIPTERIVNFPITNQARKAVLPDAEEYPEILLTEHGQPVPDPHYFPDRMYMQANETSIPFDFVGYGEDDMGPFPSQQSGDLQWFKKSVWFDEKNNQTYRDPVTDNHRLIDLLKDINMDEYDVISIIKYPRNEFYWSLYNQLDSENAQPMTPMRKQLEDLVDQIKDQVITHNKRLYINDPFAAIAFGIVDKVEYVPTFIESSNYDRRIGAQNNLFDYRSAQIDPFNGADPTKPKGRYITQIEASRYEDTHANTKQIVVQQVEGLTDMPSWILTDMIRWWNVNPFGIPPYKWSSHFDERPFGLEIGDTFYMDGDWYNPNRRLPVSDVQTRVYGMVATPRDHIKVGSAVTAFAPLVYQGQGYKGNPYYNHAVSIVVKPGDVWNGKVVGGKVYVNFTEGFTHQPEEKGGSAIMQLRSRGWPDGLYPGQTIVFKDGASWTITEEHLYYQFSTHFAAERSVQFDLPRGHEGDWGWSPGGTRGTATGEVGQIGGALNYFWVPIVDMEPINTMPMYRRGLLWLLKDADVGGNATANVETARVSVTSVEPEVAASVNVSIDLSTVRVNVEAHNDADTISPDVTVLLATPEVGLKVIGITEDVVVSTPSVVTYANESTYDFDINWEQAIVLTLPTQTMTLILEDA